METIFCNVDTQYDFMRPDGKLYVQGAEKIEENLVRLTELAKIKRIKVINTADWHNENSEELSASPNFIQTFPEHCMQNTPGAEFIPATDPENPYKINFRQNSFDIEQVLQRRNLILYKDKFDVFKGNLHANRIVELINPQRAIIYGVATNVCVNDAVKGLLERKVQVYVPINAIKELPNLPLPYETWQRKGVVLTTIDKIYRMLEERK